MSSSSEQNNNWDLAILTAVILLLLSFWLYRFLFTPNLQENPISFDLFTSVNASPTNK